MRKKIVCGFIVFTIVLSTGFQAFAAQTKNSDNNNWKNLPYRGEVKAINLLAGDTLLGVGNFKNLENKDFCRFTMDTALIIAFSERITNNLTDAGLSAAVGNNNNQVDSNKKNVGRNREVYEDENGNEVFVDIPDTGENDEPISEIKTVFHDLKQDLFFDSDSKDLSEIEKYIQQNIDNKFSLDKFKVTIADVKEYDYQSAVIRFNYCVNGYIAKEGYIILVKDGKVTTLTSGGTINYDLVDNSNLIAEIDVNDITDDEVKEMAIDQKCIDHGYEVTEQRISRMFDQETLETSIIVFTDYEDPTAKRGPIVEKYVYSK